MNMCVLPPTPLPPPHTHTCTHTSACTTYKLAEKEMVVVAGNTSRRTTQQTLASSQQQDWNPGSWSRMRSNLTHLVSRRSKYQMHAVSAACCGFWHFVLCAKGVSLLRALSMFRWPSCCHFSLSLSSKVLLSLLPSGVMRQDLIYVPISLHVPKY